MYTLSEIGNQVLENDTVEIALDGGFCRNAQFGVSVRRIVVTGGMGYGSFILANEAPVTVVLRDCILYGMMGVPAIYKEKGDLRIEAFGNSEVYGCDAVFGPSSHAESAAVWAEKVTVCRAKNATLTLHGGRTFASLFEETAQYCVAIGKEVIWEKE